MTDAAVERGSTLALRIARDLSRSESLFRAWIDAILSERQSYRDSLRASLRLRSMFEVRGRRIVHSARKRVEGGNGAASAKRRSDGIAWSHMFRPFADDTTWMAFDCMDADAVAGLLEFLKRPRTDGFRSVEGSLQGTSVLLKCFAYDDYINAYLERGLGLLLFLNALERRLGGGAVDILCVADVLAELPETDAARTGHAARLGRDMYWTGRVASLIEEMFAEDLSGEGIEHGDTMDL